MIFKFEIKDDAIATRAVENIAESCGWTEMDGPPADVEDKETKFQYGLRKWRMYPLKCSLRAEPKLAAKNAEITKRNLVKAEIDITEVSTKE